MGCLQDNANSLYSNYYETDLCKHADILLVCSTVAAQNNEMCEIIYHISTLADMYEFESDQRMQIE